LQLVTTASKLAPKLQIYRVEGYKDKVKAGENMEFNIETASFQLTVSETESPSAQKYNFI